MTDEGEFTPEERREMIQYVIRQQLTLVEYVRLGLAQYYENVGGGPTKEPDDCMCLRCRFVRGIRGELAAFDKSEAQLAKKNEKRGKT